MPKATATRAERRASRDAGAIAPYSGLQLAYAALIAAVSVASGLQAQQRGSLYGGRSVAHVWWYGWVTALSTGLGALPMAFVKDVGEWWVGLGNAVAAGMMTAASAALIEEGLGIEPPAGGLPATHSVAAGIAVGVAFIVASQRLLDQHEDVKLGVLHGVDARQALLIVFVMTMHSFSEGVSIGVSFGGQAQTHLGALPSPSPSPARRLTVPARPPTGMLITTTLAIHNVPEGFAVSVVLVSRGMSVLGAALWSVTTSVPQPLMAVVAYLFVDQFVYLQVGGLAFAAGAMLYVAWVELFKEALEACGLLVTSLVGVAAGGMMWMAHEWIE